MTDSLLRYGVRKSLLDKYTIISNKKELSSYFCCGAAPLYVPKREARFAADSCFLLREARNTSINNTQIPA